MKLSKMVTSLLAAGLLMASAVPAFAYSTVTASGSTAILPMAKQAAEYFMHNNANVGVSVSGGGSFTGLKQVNEGSVQIGDSDVPAEGSEYASLVPHKVAVAPFVIITNKRKSVKNLSQQQLINIFTGKITNWKEVGGNDEAITIIGRSKTSGSRATIKKIVLNGQEFTDSALVQDSSGALRTAVANTPGSIGYVDAAYINNAVKVLEYNGVPYTDNNVIDGKYPIWTYEYMYTKGEATGVTKEFIASILAPSFQETFVDKLGFIPMSKMEGRRAKTETKTPVKPTPKPPVKKHVISKPAVKRAIGSTYVVDGRVWKVGKDGKSYFVKLAPRVKGSTYIKNGRVWFVGKDGKDNYVKQAQ